MLYISLWFLRNWGKYVKQLCIYSFCYNNLLTYFWLSPFVSVLLSYRVILFAQYRLSPIQLLFDIIGKYITIICIYIACIYIYQFLASCSWGPNDDVRKCPAVVDIKTAALRFFLLPFLPSFFPSFLLLCPCYYS